MQRLNMAYKRIQIPQSNYQKGRGGKKIDRVVIHWIVGSLASADATFQDPQRIASAHYGIENDDVHQYVDEADTAYHCGNFSFNQRSIGIEHSAAPDRPASDRTYTTSALKISVICTRYGIPIDRTHIVGHKEVSATQCPGTMDIDRLIRMALQIRGPSVPTPINMDDKRLAYEFRKLIQHNASYKDAAAVLKALSDKDGVIGSKDKELQSLRGERELFKQQLEECKSQSVDDEFTKLGHAFADTVKKAQSI